MKPYGGGRRVDHLPHVQAHPVAQHRQLVDQRDIDAAEDVLEQLHQLGGIGRGDGHYRVHADGVQRAGAAAALRRGPDHLVVRTV
jgi:hypothetical protein